MYIMAQYLHRELLTIVVKFLVFVSILCYKTWFWHRQLRFSAVQKKISIQSKLQWGMQTGMKEHRTKGVTYMQQRWEDIKYSSREYEMLHSGGKRPERKVVWL